MKKAILLAAVCLTLCLAACGNQDVSSSSASNSTSSSSVTYDANSAESSATSGSKTDGKEAASASSSEQETANSKTSASTASSNKQGGSNNKTPVATQAPAGNGSGNKTPVPTPAPAPDPTPAPAPNPTPAPDTGNNGGNAVTDGGHGNDIIPGAPEKNPDGTWEGDGGNAEFDEGAVPPPPIVNPEPEPAPAPDPVPPADNGGNAVTDGGHGNDIIQGAPEQNPDGTWEGDGGNAETIERPAPAAE